MSTHSVERRLQHIAVCVARCEAVAARGREAFSAWDFDGVQLRSTADRALQIIGEAARALPHEWKDQRPELPWGQINGIRNRVVHNYDGVDMDLLWEVITVEVPLLTEMLDLPSAGAAEDFA